MPYRIKIDLAFPNASDMDDIRDKALDKLGDAVTINPGTDAQERGFIILHECHHDTSPMSPCPIIEEHWTPGL